MTESQIPGGFASGIRLNGLAETDSSPGQRSFIGAPHFDTYRIDATESEVDSDIGIKIWQPRSWPYVLRGVEFFTEAFRRSNEDGSAPGVPWYLSRGLCVLRGDLWYKDFYDDNLQMPMMPTFWSQLFGICTDKFGVGWMIAKSSNAEPA